MKNGILLLFLLCLPLLSFSQKFETVNIVNNGHPDKRINYVFLSDGYQENELAKFETDVRQVVDFLFSQSPLKEYKSYFNIYAIKVPSAESGATHPGTASDESSSVAQPVITVNNYFGSTFDYLGIHRLLYTPHTTKIMNVLAANMPEYDQVFILVNSSYYGGSGGNFATSSTHSQAPEVAIHEIGHSFAKVADEYWAGVRYERESINMTQETNPNLVKWKNWHGESGIGIYPHQESPNWHRPHNDCKMRKLGFGFCAVCREAFVERIHQLVDPLQSWTPTSSEISSGTGALTFTLNLLAPEPNTFKTEWKLNGQTVQRKNSVLQLDVNALRPGNNTLAATVIDTTTFSRSDTHGSVHLYNVNWTITHTPTGIKTASVAQDMRLAFYPNPTSDLLNITFTLKTQSPVQFELLTLDGKVVHTKRLKRQQPGEHQLELPLQKLTPGVYLLRVDFNGSSYTHKIVKSN